MSTNSLPKNCEKCGTVLDTTEHGTPRYRCVTVLRGSQPPISRKFCIPCWEIAMGLRAPADVESLRR